MIPTNEEFSVLIQLRLVPGRPLSYFPISHTKTHIGHIVDILLKKYLVIGNMYVFWIMMLHIPCVLIITYKVIIGISTYADYADIRMVF